MFFLFFTVGLIGQENVFVVILERKKAFLDSKITKLKKSKFWYFSKGAGFGPWVKNLKFLLVFIFGEINQQNVFDVILESQKAFLHHKKQKVKKVEKLGFFPRGLVHGFKW